MSVRKERSLKCQQFIKNYVLIDLFRMNIDPLKHTKKVFYFIILNTFFCKDILYLDHE